MGWGAWEEADGGWPGCGHAVTGFGGFGKKYEYIYIYIYLFLRYHPAQMLMRRCEAPPFYCAFVCASECSICSPGPAPASVMIAQVESNANARTCSSSVFVMRLKWGGGQDQTLICDTGSESPTKRFHHASDKLVFFLCFLSKIVI